MCLHTPTHLHTLPLSLSYTRTHTWMYAGAPQVQMRCVRKEGSGDGVRDVRGQILRGVSGNLPPEGARGV